MRPIRTIIAALVAGGGLFFTGGQAQADGPVFEVIHVDVSLPGYGNPPESQKAYCDQFPGFPNHETIPAGKVRLKNGNTVTLIVFSSYTIMPDYDSVSYYVGCKNDEGETADGSVKLFWVKAVSPATAIPGVWEEALDLIYSPSPSWPSKSDANGWVIVKTPMDVRVTDDVNPFVVSASVSNITGSATTTVNVLPAKALYDPGEPGAEPAIVECDVWEVMVPWREDGTGCHYVYQNSSAIADELAFSTRTGLRWELTSPDGYHEPETRELWTDEALPVAEVQAIVTDPG